MKKFVLLPFVLLALSACGGDDSSAPPLASPPTTPVPAACLADSSCVVQILKVSNGTKNPITIYAPMTLDEKYLHHVANISAGYLDNDSDGVWDNEVLSQFMSDNESAMFIPKEQNNERAEMEWMLSLPTDIRNIIMDDSKAQSLYGGEIFLCDSKTSFDDCFEGTTDRDPSYEEVLHLITHTGYSVIEPSIFGEDVDGHSLVSLSNDKARSDESRVLNNDSCGLSGENCDWGKPSFSYSDDAWWHYTDGSCNYECQVTEYTYHIINSAMGMMEHLDGTPFANIWSCMNISDFNSGGFCEADTGIQSIYGAGASVSSGTLVAGNNVYNVPTKIPFGDYKPSGTKREWIIEYR